MNKKIQNIIIKAGNLALQRQESDGSMPSGRNGPHNHNMTPARNTGHFSILFSYLYILTNDEKWREASIKCLKKLLKLRPLDGSFWHRNEDFKPSYNGLIGQAWSIEALTYSSKIFNDDKYLKEAKEVIKLHKFDSNLGLWHDLDLDGSARVINMTLNQQIWFMAMALKACPNNDHIIKFSNNFLNKIGNYIKIRRNGLLFTAIYVNNKNRLKVMYKSFLRIANSRRRMNIDYGYHLFTLVGLAELYEMLPNHKFFKSKKFVKILKFCFSNKYKDNITKSEYGYPYNVPGFEIVYVYFVFKNMLPKNKISVVNEVFKHQISNHFNKENLGLLANNSLDIETLAARIYEIYRIKEDFWRNLNEKDIISWIPS